jgi:VanZ family protein
MSGSVKILLKIPAVLVVITIWFLSSQSVLPQLKGILGYDKLLHLLAYLALSGSAALWFPPEQWESRRFLTFLLTVIIASVYGMIDEIHQSFVPGRDCSVWDWIADTLGAMIGAGAGMLGVRRIASANKKMMNFCKRCK